MVRLHDDLYFQFHTEIEAHVSELKMVIVTLANLHNRTVAHHQDIRREVSNVLHPISQLVFYETVFHVQN